MQEILGECIDQCLQTALTMAKENPNVYVPQQFGKHCKSHIHRKQTALEIIKQVDILSMDFVLELVLVVQLQGLVKY